jgi:phosphoribosylformylglycinamidine synthase
VSEGRPRIAVVTFPGSNDDGDARLALERLGADAVPVWHAVTELDPDVGGVVLPGGFSYGDYLRCGALARSAPVMDAVRAFAADGGPVLGICNGFQILCEAGLLPGVLRPNRQLEFLCADVTVVVESTGTPFTGGLDAGDELVIPIKHGEGNWVVDDASYDDLIAHGQIVLRYRDDVNGSRDRVAGVGNRAGNVLGLMPHPEHAVDPLLGPTGGAPLLEGLVAAASRSPVGPAVGSR